MNYITIAQPSDDECHELAASLALWACTDGTMASDRITAQKSTIFHEVTLGLDAELARKQGWFFSSCAFLPLWMLECLGFGRAQGQLGRDMSEAPGVQAQNPLARLAWHKFSESLAGGMHGLDAGDVIQIGSNGDSHVYVALFSVGDWQITCAQYGLGAPAGGDVHELEVTRPVGSKYEWHGSNDAQGKRHSRPARRRLRLGVLIEKYPERGPTRVPEPLWDHPLFALRAHLKPL